jgi:hypothetical protein
MKLSLTKFTSLFGFAFAVSTSGPIAFAQIQSQTGFGGATQGFGGTTQGIGGTAGVGGTGANTGVTNTQRVGPFGGLGVSGAFGGQGTSGVRIQEFSTINPAVVFSAPTAAGGQTGTGTIGGAQLGATTPGGGGFGTTGTQGGFGGGLGGGLGTGLGFGLGSGLTSSRTGGLGGIGGLGSQGGGRTSSANAKSKIRTIVRPDIEVVSQTSAAAAANVQARMGRIPLPKRIANVKFILDGDTVVLRGQVANESDKKLAERLVMLEPGVDSVRNEVQVQNK